MLDGVVITMIDGMHIVVPDSLESMTPYVLREQQDFLEDKRLLIDRARTANGRLQTI
jgi:hypothetical protein